MSTDVNEQQISESVTQAALPGRPARHEEGERRREIAEGLRELVAVVNSGRSLQEILDRVVVQASHLIGSDESTILMPTPENPAILRTRSTTTNLESLIVPRPIDRTAVGLPFLLRRPVAVYDGMTVYGTAEAPDTPPRYEDRGSHVQVTLLAEPEGQTQQKAMHLYVSQFRGLLAVPLLAADEVLGTLTFIYRAPRKFADEEVNLAMTFADQAALAIHNARLHEQATRAAAREEKQRRVAECLRDLLGVVNSGRPLQEILEAVAAEANSLVGSDASSIVLPTELPDVLMTRATTEPDPEFPWLPGSPRVASLAFRVGRPAAIHNIPGIYGDSTEPDTLPSFEDIGSHLKVTFISWPTDPAQLARSRRFVENYGAFLAAPLVSREERLGVLTFLYRSPREFTAEEVSLATAFADQATLAIQNARLHEQAQHAAAREEKQRQVAEGLRDLLAVVNSRRPSQEILDAVVRQASRLVRSDASSILLPVMEEEQVLRTQASTEDDDDMMATLPVSRSAAGLAFLLGRPTAVYDIQGVYGTDDALPRYEDEGSHVRVTFLPEQSDSREREKARRFAVAYKSFLGVPLTSGDEPLGVLTFLYRDGRQFSDEEVALAVALADQAALALQNARLHEQAQHAATLEERQRLARDLHDAVTQTLFSTALIAEVIPDLMSVDENEGRQRLQDLRRLTRGALAEMRTLLVELRPGALTEMPLGDLLSQLAEAISGRTKIAVTASSAGKPRRLPDEVQVALYRVAQESLNNVVKHARATTAIVHVGWHSSGSVSLSVTDDGAGFDVEAIPSGHLGVGIMRERAAAIGAVLTLASRPGETSVKVFWRAEEMQQ